MKTKTLKSLIIALLACTLFISCNKEKTSTEKDVLIQEMIDTLLFHQERYDGDAMLTTLDSLKSLGVDVCYDLLLATEGWGHAKVCEESYTTERLKWLFEL